MPRSDETLRERLSAWVAGTAVTLQTLLDWHADAAVEGETLLAFLVRTGVFKADAPRALGLMDKGYLSASISSSVMADGWQTKISRRPSPVIEEEPTDVLDFGSMREPVEPPPMASGTSTRNARRPVTESTRSGRTGARPAAPTWPPTRGSVLGKYLLTEPIGKGTSGLVFRAINQVLNLSVAIKVLSLPEDGSAGCALEALAAEARLLASLNHPNVVRLWDFEADPAHPYLVMEYVDGPSLAELIRTSGRMSFERAVELMTQAGEGLAAAWEVGIVHRDVKPHNILVGRDGRPKIADLGLAVVTDGSVHSVRDEFAGTAAYMSPEQGLLADVPVDLRSDIYSLGATLYHALTGRTPYPGTNSRELMHQHATSQPVPPHHVVPGMPPEVSDVVLTMMARHPDDRYYTAAELLTALRGLTPAPIRPETDGATMRTRQVTASGQAPRPSGFWRRLFTGGTPS